MGPTISYRKSNSVFQRSLGYLPFFLPGFSFSREKIFFPFPGSLGAEAQGGGSQGSPPLRPASARPLDHDE